MKQWEREMIGKVVLNELSTITKKELNKIERKKEKLTPKLMNRYYLLMI
jgi:hypothetical protein